jgi:ABC-type lipoprotein export system ATPase subunit
MADIDRVLKLINVSHAYEAGPGVAPIPILNGVSLDVAGGESLAIVGPSGCGKSTLLNIIGTLDKPQSGQVILNGRDVSKLDANQLADIRNREIGFIFQAHHLLPYCTVLENVLVPTVLDGDEHDQRSSLDRAEKLLARVGLENRMDHLPGRISGGERQRVAVVRALINKPKLLLADEPTGSLDAASAEQLAALLQELNTEESVTLILVTHDRKLAGSMKRVMELRNGALDALQ